MNRQRISTLIFVMIITCVSLGSTGLAFGGQNHGPNGEEGEFSTLAGLKSENIRILISTAKEHGEHKEQLYQRASRLFRSAGLTINVEQEILANLKLTLKAKPIPGLPGKYLYIQSLDLLELVTLRRPVQVSVQAITWSYGQPQPIITNAILPQKLESDLDNLVLQFIQSYKLANPEMSP